MSNVRSRLPRMGFALSCMLALGCSADDHTVMPQPDPTMAGAVIDALSPVESGDGGLPVAETTTIGADTQARPVATVPVETFRGEPLAALLDAMTHAPVLARHERFSSTTAVYHLELEGGVHVAFKPSVRGYSEAWKHEVIAYHLGRLLGLTDRVPPVVARLVPFAALGRAARFDHLARWPADHDMVIGAAIYWYPVLRSPPLIGAQEERRWIGWLHRGHRIPSASAHRAEQLSTLLVFDYLQANTDRIRPGNIRADEHDDLIYRDNNDGWSLSLLSNPRSVLWRLDWTQRFRRSVIDALRRVEGNALGEEVERDPGPGHPLISRAAMRAFDRRRSVVLDRVDAMVARHGEDSVFVW